MFKQQEIMMLTVQDYTDAIAVNHAIRAKAVYSHDELMRVIDTNISRLHRERAAAGVRENVVVVAREPRMFSTDQCDFSAGSHVSYMSREVRD